MFLILIPGRKRKTLPCPIAELSTNVMLYVLHWPESAMLVSIEGSNCKAKENLLLKTCLVLDFRVTSLQHLIDSIDASSSGFVSHCTLPGHIYYRDCSIVYFGSASSILPYGGWTSAYSMKFSLLLRLCTAGMELIFFIAAQVVL